MRKPIPQGELLFYLLHFDAPVSGKEHYAGTTTKPRFADRMREHQLGTGASLTRRAHLASIGFRLGCVEVIETRETEKKIKRAGHLKNRCIQCMTGQKAQLSLLCNERYEAVPAMDTSRLNFTVLPNKGRINRKK